MQNRKYGNILPIVLLFTIFSCNDTSKKVFEETKDQEVNVNERLLAFCRDYSISMDSSEVIILPPSSCVQCHKGGLNELKKHPQCYILHSKTDECGSFFTTQKCIAYDAEKMREKGLDNVYSEVVKIRNAKIVFRKALFN